MEHRQSQNYKQANLQNDRQIRTSFQNDNRIRMDLQNDKQIRTGPGEMRYFLNFFFSKYYLVMVSRDDRHIIFLNYISRICYSTKD